MSLSIRPATRNNSRITHCRRFPYICAVPEDIAISIITIILTKWNKITSALTVIIRGRSLQKRKIALFMPINLILYTDGGHLLVQIILVKGGSSLLTAASISLFVMIVVSIRTRFRTGLIILRRRLLILKSLLLT